MGHPGDSQAVCPAASRLGLRCGCPVLGLCSLGPGFHAGASGTGSVLGFLLPEPQQTLISGPVTMLSTGVSFQNLPTDGYHHSFSGGEGVRYHHNLIPKKYFKLFVKNNISGNLVVP